MNTLRITVDNPGEILTGYGANAVIAIQSGAAQLGPFAALTTVTVLAETTGYTAYDAAGSDASWYRSRYQSADGLTASDWSDAWQADVATEIVTLEEVRTRLGLKSTDHDDDAVLVGFIAQATEEFEGYTERWLVPHDGETLTFDGIPNSRRLRIGKGVRVVNSLRVRTAGTGSAFVTIDTQYIYLRPAIQDRPTRAFPATEIWLSDLCPYEFPSLGFEVIEANVDAGFASTPATLREIAKNAIVRAFRARAAGQADTVGTNALGQSIILRQLAPAELDTLDRYRDLTY